MSVRCFRTSRCFGGELGFYEHHSLACGDHAAMRVAVFVPPGPGPFPVVTFLGGLTDTVERVAERVGGYRVAAELGLILVVPATRPPGASAGHWDVESGWYVDATEAAWSHYQMATYVTREVPAWVDEHFPTRGPDARSLMGLGTGGHGALVHGLREPDRYRSLSAFAPVCSPTRVPWGDNAFSVYLGDDRARWSAYDPTELVSARQHPSPILVDQGSADAFLEEQLRPELFAAACERHGQSLELREHEGYDHSYFFVRTFIEEHLRHHARSLAR